MRTLPARPLLLLLLLTACGLAACSRRAPSADPGSSRRPPGPADAAAAQGPEAAGTQEPREAEASQDLGPQPSREILLRRESAPPEAPPAAPSPQEREEQALLALPGPAALPEDFKIGALADLFQADSSARAAAAAAREFLAALARGEVPGQLIEADRRGGLENSLAHYLSAGPAPQSFRLGSVAFAEGSPEEARLNVRLFASPGRTEGEIYLTRVSQRWVVRDLQVELAALAQPYSRPEDRFYPSVYAWGLE